MGRRKTELETTYGVLTVLHELPDYHVRVKCICGTEKDVQRSNLFTGRVKSCGATVCRRLASGKEVTVLDTPPVLTGPRVRNPSWIAPDMIRTAWDDFYLRGVEAQHIADKYAVHAQSVYQLFKRIRDSGGIDAYMARIESNVRAVPKSTGEIVVNPVGPIDIDTTVRTPPDVYVAPPLKVY